MTIRDHQATEVANGTTNGNGRPASELVAAVAREARAWHELHDERCLQLQAERQARRVAEGDLAVKDIQLRREVLRRRMAEGDVAAAAQVSVITDAAVRKAADELIFAVEHLVSKPSEIPSPSSGGEPYPDPAGLLLWVLKRGGAPPILASNLLDAMTLLGFAGRFTEAVEFRRVRRETDVLEIVQMGRQASEAALAVCG